MYKEEHRKNNRFRSGMVLCALVAIVSSTTLSVAAGPQPDELWMPVAFGLYPAWEWPDEAYDVKGFRFNLLAGRHGNVYGVDLGALVNVCDKSCAGMQFAGLCNVVGDAALSAQFAAACNYSHRYSKGFQLAVVNWADEDFAGVQMGGFNCAGDFTGLQMGVLNSAESGGGFQLGVVNVSDEFVGVQFGLINLNLSSGVPVLPIMNIMF